MNIITKKGIKEFEKIYDSKLVQGDPLKFYLTFKPLTEEAKSKIIWACRDKRVDYNLLGSEVITISQDALYQILPSSCFEDKRCWKGKDQIFICSEMKQSHLSNILGYLEILLTLNKISKKNSEDYMEKLQESIIPELEERFNGEILPYEPYYAYEKDLYKEFLKVTKGK